MAYSYWTIKGASQGVYREKGSKFLAFAYPVADEDEIRQRIDILKKEYFDARHHCFAWVLGPEKDRHRAFDDGEPNHSAGAPILGQIKSRNLTNILVVVVRYFGGVKLGVGGLTAAYKEAANGALNNSTRVEHEIVRSFVLEYAYAETNDVMKLINDCSARIGRQQFLERCTTEVNIPLKSLALFEERIHYLLDVGKTSLKVREVFP